MALLSALPLSQTCTLSAGRAPAVVANECLSHFNSLAAGRVRSTLSRRDSSQSEQLHGVTEVASDGTRLVEDVTLDDSGALKSAEAVLTQTDDISEKRVRFDPEHGSVEVTTAGLRLHWDVPHDYPWIWAPLLTANGANGAITTPLDARVVWRAAGGGRTVRLLDLGNLQSYTLTADQVASREGDAGTVVLGNDASEIEQGMPKRLHVAAMNTDLVSTDLAEKSSALLAVLGCTPPRGLFAR
jgi:hypothetical protein